MSLNQNLKQGFLINIPLNIIVSKYYPPSLSLSLSLFLSISVFVVVVDFLTLCPGPQILSQDITLPFIIMPHVS